MGVIVYNIFLLLFRLVAGIGSLFSVKTRKWVKGRKGIFLKLKSTIPSNAHVVWMHCASLGEFEQGRPLLDAIRNKYPAYKLLLTFFSPSGYEVRKNYEGADYVFYLPMDGPRNAKRFLEIVHPSLVIFIKYEFWYYYLKKIRYRKIPLLLVSAIFRPEMPFFKWHGEIQRKMLSRFDQLFVQDEYSKKLVEDIGVRNSVVAGDTRFDRVASIAAHAKELPLIESFLSGCHNIIVAGSTWPEDESLLTESVNFFYDAKWIIAPHEITDSHLNELKQKFPTSIRYSELSQQTSNVLIIDNIGMLSSLYRYATITYIGGGFGKGIHNTLEAAVFGKPVLFGPAHTKFKEALDLIAIGAAYSISNALALQEKLKMLTDDKARYTESAAAAERYVKSNQGATGLVMEYIQVNRLLTN